LKEESKENWRGGSPRAKRKRKNREKKNNHHFGKETQGEKIPWGEGAIKERRTSRGHVCLGGRLTFGNEENETFQKNKSVPAWCEKRKRGRRMWVRPGGSGGRGRHETRWSQTTHEHRET